MSSRAALAAAAIALFIVVATLNAGGYRYGASDQAFYIPAIEHHLDPTLFPRDWPMLAAQDRLNTFTPLVARLSAVTGAGLPALFLALYVAGLAALGAGAWLLGRRLYRSTWTVAALLAALTLRHAVALGAVNTLEGYLHPRMLAFAAGTLALAAFLRRRDGWAATLGALALALHPTTGAWFALWLWVAATVGEPRWRRSLLALGVAGAAACAWAVASGPLAGRLFRIDDEWVAALGAKTYLFPDRWPVWAWASAIFTVGLAAAGFRLRRRLGLADRRETGLAAGAAALAAVLLGSLPFVAARVALFVQLQIPRVLWPLDLAAIVLLVWLLAEGRAAGGEERASARERTGTRRPAVVAAVLIAFALARGAWVTLVEHPERALVQMHLAATDWNAALDWVRRETPTGAHVLADPGHAWRYGTSVRAGALRDVFLEEAKDGAFALYSRDAAVRFVERVRATQGFDAFDAEQVKRLAEQHSLDVLVTERALNLPLMHQSGRFKVYSLP